MKESRYVFEYYRYQLVPKKVIQLTIDNVPFTVEQLKAKKNEFFATVLTSVTFKNSEAPLPLSISYQEDDVYLLLIGNNRHVEYIKEFESMQIDSEPYSVVIVDNHPEKQIIAIRNDRRAFSSADTLIKLIKGTINNSLSYYNIEMHVESISPQNGFWEAIIESGKKGKYVSKITFEIIKPNITNIASTLQDEIKSFIDKTNSHKTTVSIEATTNGQLTNINKTDPDLSSLSHMLRMEEEGPWSSLMTKVHMIRKSISKRQSIRLLLI